MPYIAPEARQKIHVPRPNSGGELQYMIAEMINKMLLGKKNFVRYSDLEEVMGALAGAQQEFYRIVVAPYEDKKLKENGEVYSPEYYFDNTSY